MTKALIDADILCYEFGNMKDLETGELLAWPIVRKFVDERIEEIVNATEATEKALYLTDSASNFRNKVATILPYKGHRAQEKPPHWRDIREHLVDNYDAEVQYGIEADDACGITQCANNYVAHNMALGGHSFTETIICSRDKDLKMIPGWHYSWACGNQKEEKFFVTKEEGIRFFYKQLLTGDATDNILGLYRVGPKASCVKDLDSMTEEKDMALHVISEYKARFGNHWYRFMSENAALLWIHRHKHDDIHDPMGVKWRDWEEECEEKKDIQEEEGDTKGL